MKEALVSAGPQVRIVDSPTPNPGPDQVAIKVVVSGSNPKDWMRAEASESPMNTGDDIAGVVEAVGRNVVEFKPGDRVAAFHEMMSAHGSFAEYAISDDYTAFHIPKKTSFEEAATIPLAAMTAAVALYQQLGLPLPWKPATAPLPLIINGAAGAVGSFAIQLAVQSNIHPLICIAGKSHAHVESLVDKSKGDEVLDYRVGADQLAQALKAVIVQKSTDGRCYYAFDTITTGTYQTLCQALDQESGKSQLAVIKPYQDYPDIPKGIGLHKVFVGASHENTDKDRIQKQTGTKVGNQEFAYLLFRYMGRGLQKGYFKGHPYEIVPGGLGGVEKGLADLKAGKASAVKYIFKMDETK